jgi:hydrogenase-4 component B
MVDVGILLIMSLVICLAGMTVSAIARQQSVPRILAITGALAALVGIVMGAAAFIKGETFHFTLWSLPALGTLQLSFDTLSAIFTIVAGLIFIPISIFSREYLRHYLERTNLKTFIIFYIGLLTSIVVLTFAGDIFTFLIAWEVMSISSYLLVNTERESNEARQASYLMLSIGEAGTLAVAVAFLILANAAGSPAFSAIKAAAPNLSEGSRWAVFLLSFFGFGVKVGLLPFNFWLPRAHPVAPANVSALVSSVVLNLGLYGILRVNLDLLPITSVAPGLIILIIGALSALVGILYATIENDFKTLLAHSSIENMGIIAVGLGAGFVFLASGQAVLASIAFIAAIYHMINHSVYKSLLFLGAGAVNVSTGTCDLDRLGGLLKKMPWTGLFVLVGMLGISALPPFNGFVSEWLTLQSLLRSVELSSIGVQIAFVAAGAGLALTAGLAVTCFVRAFSMGFLGMARSKVTHTVHEVGKFTLTSMASLALICLLLGVLPTYVIPAIDRVVTPLTGASGAEALVPPFFVKNAPASQLPPDFAADFHNLGAQIGQNVLPGTGLAVLHRGGTANPVVFAMSTSYMLVALFTLLGLSAGLVWFFVARRRKAERRPRWDGGVKSLLPEMTYTATGFAQPVRVIFEAILRPTAGENRVEAIAEHFRLAIHRERKEIHLLDRLVLHPLSASALWISDKLARMHNGRVNTYAAYALLALIVILLIALFR